ncbi:MAG: aminoacyl-tRNA hydrolase [Candidatus Devosia euplotis]|nr:aminoacyl-tRNA hydrolase [Candidatus Devosia euplotis]
MKLLVGLGNPGSQHQGNRHNIGFMALDAIARAHAITQFRTKHSGSLAEGIIGDEKVILLKPQTFMNRSGDSVQQVAKFYKIEPADIIVLYDELDLAPGKVRVKIGGGNGGHNGLRSIDPQIGLSYKRVRLGIGHPGKENVTHHVLGDFAKANQSWLEPLLDAIGQHVGLLLRGDDSGFMNKLALATRPADADDSKTPAKGQTSPVPKGQSHVRQVDMPSGGPMANMLKKLFKGN